MPGPTASHAPCGKGDEYTENAPRDHSDGNSTFHKRTDVTSAWFPQDLMMCFVTKKKIKELVGRRDSGLEQVHREQKGKKDTQNFLGHQVQPAASMLHPFRHHFLHSSPTFHLLTISLQRCAPRLPTWQLPCLLSLQSTPAISSQARLVLPASLPPVLGLPQC